MRDLIYFAKAFIVGAVLGGGFGSMMMGGHHIVQGIVIGTVATVSAAWLVVARERDA
jgi:hypothetical protein